MGVCNSPYTMKMHKRNTSIHSEKGNTEFDFSKNITRSSSTNIIISYKYFCTFQKKIYYCDYQYLKNNNIFICGCELRKDKSIDNLKKHEENLNWGKCFKHTIINYKYYCFECEICLCDECIKGFHEKYFNTHHLFINPKIL